MGSIMIISAPVPARSSAGASLKICAWIYLFPPNEKTKISKRGNFQAYGLRFNGQERAGKENSKPAKSLKASRGMTQKDRYGRGYLDL